MNISWRNAWSMPVITLLSIDTSSLGTFGLANISNSWYMSSAPISCAMLCGTGIEKTDFAPYVADDALTGYGIHRSVSPRRNFASAVLMSVWGARENLSPVLLCSSARRSPTNPAGLPFSSVSGNGHGEKSIIIGLSFCCLRASQLLSVNESAAMSVRRP